MNNFDEVFVIYDKENDKFYCGQYQWDKQLRKAKFYKSYNWARKQEDLCWNDTGIYKVQMRVCDEIEDIDI